VVHFLYMFLITTVLGSCVSNAYLHVPINITYKLEMIALTYLVEENF
jgi:hypothetical protein